MDEQEFLERFGMTREEYGNKYGVLQDPNMGKGATLRQKAVDKVAGALQGLGSDQYSAYKTARDFLGDADSSSIAESVGLIDFSPLQLPFAIQETKRAYDRGDKVEAGVGATIALVEMFPGMKLASAPLKGFLRSLGKKSMAKEAPVDLSRRKALGAIAAAPVAATALSSIPVGKVIDDVVPAIKNVVKKIPLPEKFNPISDLSEVKDTIDDILRLNLEDDVDNVDDIIEQMDLGKRTEIAQEESIAGIDEIAVRQLKEEYDVSDEEIANILSKFFDMDKDLAKEIVEAN